MKKLLGACLLLALIGASAIIFAFFVQNPLPITLSWGVTVVSTQAIVVVTIALFLALALFYLGQGVFWLQNLPMRWGDIRQKKKQAAFLSTLASALAAEKEGNLKAFAKFAKSLSLEGLSEAETALAHMVLLPANLMKGAVAEQALSNSISGAIVALSMARQVAKNANWAEVRRLTALGLQSSPTQPALLALHFKALINLNDPAAETFIPRLASLLGPSAFTLLSGAIQGISSTQASQLGHPWLKSFQAWIPTPSETFPPYHKEDSL